MTPEQDIECLRYLAKFKGDDDVLGDVPFTLLESVADRLERLTAENERLRAALSSSESWIDRWTSHVGTCEGGNKCTCGRSAVLFDAGDALNQQETTKP